MDLIDVDFGEDNQAANLTDEERRARFEAAIQVANKIALGQIEAGIAAGSDSVSDAPIVYPRGYQQLLLDSARGRSLGASISARAFAASMSARCLSSLQCLSAFSRA